MERIKANKVRLVVFCISIILIIEVLFLLFGKLPRFNDIYIYIAAFLIFTIFLYVTHTENKRQNRIYFSREKFFIIDSSNKELDICWDDLEVDSSSFKFWVFDFTAYKLKSKSRSDINARFELNSLLETSALPIIKKYAPEDHDLYRVVEEYAKRTNLVF